MTCCCRCKASSPNMSEPRSWSGAGVARSTQLRVGSLNVMSNAPFGYRYISVREGGGLARFEPVAEQARIVQQIFSWIGRDRCSLAEVCRRLQKNGDMTATGKRIWSRQTVWHVLQNPAYQGRAAYGKTHMMPRGKKARPRAARGRPPEPRITLSGAAKICFKSDRFIP